MPVRLERTSLELHVQSRTRTALDAQRSCSGLPVPAIMSNPSHQTYVPSKVVKTEYPVSRQLQLSRKKCYRVSLLSRNSSSTTTRMLPPTPAPATTVAGRDADPHQLVL